MMTFIFPNWFFARGILLKIRIETKKNCILFLLLTTKKLIMMDHLLSGALNRTLSVSFIVIFPLLALAYTKLEYFCWKCSD